MILRTNLCARDAESREKTLLCQNQAQTTFNFILVSKENADLLRNICTSENDNLHFRGPL